MNREAPLDKYKQRLLYRYDPPAVLISLTWEETRAKFAPYLRQKLQFSYFNNSEDVSASPLQNRQWVKGLNIHRSSYT